MHTVVCTVVCRYRYLMGHNSVPLEVSGLEVM